MFASHHAVLACKVAGVYSFFLSICPNNHMEGTDQYYMHLMDVGNTVAQMSKVHSYYGSLHVVSYYPWSYHYFLFFGESKNNASTYA